MISSARKILIIQFYQTGDVVLTTHIPRELKKLLPDAEIDFLTFEANAPLLKYNPYINNLLTTSRKEGTGSFLKLLWKIRKNKYDVVLDFHDNPRSMQVTLASGANKKITYADSSRKGFYNNVQERIRGTAVDIKVSLLKPFTDDTDSVDRQTEIFFDKEHSEKIDSLFAEWNIDNKDFIVTMSPTHKRAVRRWAFRHFYDTAEHLIKTRNAKIIYTYGPGEKEYVEQGLAENGGLAQNMFLMPSLNLLEFTALLDRAKLHIGNDSAPHHIATARKVPTFVIIGSTSDGWVFPSKEHTFVRADHMECVPCKKSECKFGDLIPCLNEFGFKDIKNKLETFIADVVLK